MAKPTIELITALRATADRLEDGVKFHWNHMGSCNCGHLAQTLTTLNKKQIHQMALENHGDWAQQAREYCPESGYPLDTVIDKMVGIGMNVMDIANLERLEDYDVLARIDDDRKPLDYRDREDAVLYIRELADLLEERWRRKIGASRQNVDAALEPA